LALPRVRLDSATVQITPGVANLNGMLVYNTTATLGAGIYSWIGGVWKKVDAVPTPSPNDSGRYLMSNGTSVQWVPIFYGRLYNTDSILTTQTPKPVSLSLIVDTVVSISFIPNAITSVYLQGVVLGDLCYVASATNTSPFCTVRGTNSLWVQALNTSRITNIPYRIRCLRVSF